MATSVTMAVIVGREARNRLKSPKLVTISFWKTRYQR